MKKIFSIILLSLFFITNTYSQSEIPELQKNFIFNFIRYIKWPGLDNQLTFRIVVLGENHPLTKELKKSIKGYRIEGKPIEVVEQNSLNELTACHILFVPDNKSHLLKRVSKMLAGISVLIITEKNDYVPKHSAINIMIEESGRMVFTINKNIVNRRDLDVNVRLYQMAKRH